MAQANNQPITLDLPVQLQTINTDIESIAPLQGFTADSYDVANSTITATVDVPEAKTYRLVLRADVEAGTHATVRVVSSSDDHFQQMVKFERISNQHADQLDPVLQKAGLQLDPALSKEKALEEMAKQFKVADIELPVGNHVLRISTSQKLLPVDGNPKHYQLTMYAPLLSFITASNVRLAATLVFPLDFQSKAAAPAVSYESLPGMTEPQLHLGGNDPITVGGQLAYGWLFEKVDPKIVADYTYN
jgi:hypothetical protein